MVILPSMYFVFQIHANNVYYSMEDVNGGCISCKESVVYAVERFFLLFLQKKGTSYEKKQQKSKLTPKPAGFLQNNEWIYLKNKNTKTKKKSTAMSS